MYLAHTSPSSISHEEDKRPFIYMRHFRATYTQYCIKHSLEPVQSRDEIIRQLRGMVIPMVNSLWYAMLLWFL